MSTSNLDAADLAAALAGGLIAEDVVDQVYNLDEGVPTPLTDLVRSDSFKNVYSEWTEDDLNAVDTDNAVVDGADASGNDTQLGRRVGNRAQISDKVVQISTTSEEIKSIGSVGKMAYQTAKRLMDLRRDVEAIALGRQASVADNGSATAGRTAGFAAWLETNVDFGAGGAAGGFNTATKIVDAPTVGAARALEWETVRNMIESVYTAGGAADNRLVLMSVPGVIKRINSFLLSSAGAPYRATPTANVSGTSGAAQTAQGYIRYALSDFGIELTLVPNRLQQTYDDATTPTAVPAADVFLIDPKYAGLSYLYGYRVDPLAKNGLSERKQIHTQWMTKVFREDAHALIADIDPTAAVVAGS